MKHTTHGIFSFILLFVLLLLPGIASSSAKDDPLLSMVILEKLEYQTSGDQEPLVINTQGWIGKDLSKLWLKSELERSGGHLEEFELQALYSRAIAPFWDLQIGVRQDFKPSPQRSWLALGVQGLAPYFIDLEATLFFGQGRQLALRIDAEHDIPISQKLILTPEIEVNLYSQDDQALGIGAGLSDYQAGLRLRYEIVREFAPYIGIQWNKEFGETANFSSSTGERTGETFFVIGLHA